MATSGSMESEAPIEHLTRLNIVASRHPNQNPNPNR